MKAHVFRCVLPDHRSPDGRCRSRLYKNWDVTIPSFKWKIHYRSDYFMLSPNGQEYYLMFVSCPQFHLFPRELILKAKREYWEWRSLALAT